MLIIDRMELDMCMVGEKEDNIFSFHCLSLTFSRILFFVRPFNVIFRFMMPEFSRLSTRENIERVKTISGLWKYLVTTLFLFAKNSFLRFTMFVLSGRRTSHADLSKNHIADNVSTGPVLDLGK